MIFSALRLTGFKSFVDSSEVKIEPGLTGIVGPNGCGKSNLVEAVRWVMGESAYKQMRAASMDDVIFSGAANRAPRNWAEVVLVLDNSLRTAPIAHNDSDVIEVSRRIDREQGSTYRINGKEVRARDVHLLFADVSTGARSPSLVRQGQVGELISSKPVARRSLLEEAAGISGLYSRRHEAELRLKSTEQNLERVSDVIAQLETQLENLKRQARQARRYKSLSGEVRKAEAAVYYGRWSRARAHFEQCKDHTAELSATQADLQHTQTEAAKNLAIIESKLPGLRQKEAELGASLQVHRHQLSQLEKDEARRQQLALDLQNQLQDLEADKVREVKRLAELAQSQTETQAQITTLKQDLQNRKDLELSAQTALDEAQSELNALEQQLQTTRQEKLAFEQDAKNRDQQHQAAKDHCAQLESGIEKLARELETVQASLNMLQKRREGAAAIEEAQHQLSATQLEAEQAQQAATQARQALDNIRAERSDLHSALSALKAERKALGAMLDKSATSQWPPILNDIKVSKGYERAVGAVFGEDLDVPTDREAPIFWDMPRDHDDDPALPTKAKPLAQFVKAPPHLSRRLAQIGLVEPQHGSALASHLHTGQILVSLQGDVWRWDGLVVRADAPSTAAKRLQHQNRFEEVDAEIETLETKQSDIDRAFDVANTADTSCTSAQHQSAKALIEAQKHVQHVQHKAQNYVQKTEELKARKRRFTEALDEQQTALTNAQTQLKALDVARHAQSDTAFDDKQIDILQSRVHTARDKQAQVRANFMQLSQNFAQKMEQKTQLQAEQAKFVERQQEGETQIKALESRLQMLRSQQNAPQHENDTGQKRRDLQSKIDDITQQRQVAIAALEDIQNQYDAARQSADKSLGALADHRTSLARAEERQQAAKHSIVNVEQQVRENMGESCNRLAMIADIKPEDKLVEPHQAEAKLDRLKRERERLGSVNLKAEEEMVDIEQSYQTLVKDRDDLVGAIEKLRAAIGDLNKQGRKKLLKAFDLVNAHFGALFKELFGGGTAELKFVEHDDPLEAGLDIVAAPPGKKTTTLTLLSGGEQTLTALSLIFAVFLTNPAPICVLDEVDAPLDDANVGRFCDLLDAMREKTATRFMVITHNPISMARMDRLFGVTMMQKGISELVSVDLTTAESYAQQA